MAENIGFNREENSHPNITIEDLLKQIEYSDWGQRGETLVKFGELLQSEIPQNIREEFPKSEIVPWVDFRMSST